MKRFVKIISLVLTLAMVFSVMSIGAWADGNKTPAAPAEQTKTVPVNVEKVWVDNNNASGKRPVAISVALKTGGEVVKTLELSAEDGWKTQIELPANFDWKSSLTVEETKNGTDYLTDYKDSITVVPPSADGFTIVKRGDETVHTFDGVEMIILTHGDSSYIWSAKEVDEDIVNVLDDGAQLNSFNFKDTTIVTDSKGCTFKEGNGEATITVGQDGQVTLKFSAHSTWSMFAHGDAAAVEKLYGKITITNTYTPPTTSVTVVKEWANVPEGTVLPASVEVYLLANGQEVTDSRTTLDAGNKWRYTWTELPVATEDGTPIVYTVDEVAVAGYEKTITDAEVPAGVGFTITNTYTPPAPPQPETTSVTVNKVWYDVNNFDKLRPESVTVQLYANSEEYGKPVTLNDANKWTYTWEGLPVGDANAASKIVYTVDEVKVPEGYEKNIRIVKDTADGLGFVIENTHTPTSYVEFPITKVVKQGGNVAPGKETFTFEAFVMTDNGKQSLQTQTITTNGVETKGQYFTIEKSMLENGVFVREVKGSSEGWTYDEQLWLVKPAPQPMSVDDEVLIEQMDLEIFKVEIKDTHMDREPADEIVFTNTYTKNTVKPPVQEYDPEPTPKDKVVVKKVWVGDDEKTRPEEITVQLYKNGKKYEKPVKLSADEDIYENWRHVWDDVREDEDTVWSVKELNVPDGYSVSIEQRRSNYFIITNTLNEKPNPDTGASDFVGAAVALAVCSAVSGAALMLKRK